MKTLFFRIVLFLLFPAALALTPYGRFKTQFFPFVLKNPSLGTFFPIDLAASGFSHLIPGAFGANNVTTDNQSLPHSEDAIVVRIKKGMTFTQVTGLLHDKGIIKCRTCFRFYSLFGNKSRLIQHGEFALKPTDSYAKMLDTLVNGRSILHKITFPEGYNLFEMAETLEDNQFLRKQDFIAFTHSHQHTRELLNESLSSFEGYLFPDTYFFPKPVSPSFVVQAMVRRFLSIYKQFEHLDSDLSRHQALILASIIEKETSAPFERDIIASVFYNRLNKGIKLESDPTILYGMLMETGIMPINIRKQDILRTTAYNTYRIPALPPGPITNPGKEAIKAVFFPKNTPYMFFVSQNDGTHIFSKTYEEHKKFVNKYQKKRR